MHKLLKFCEKGRVTIFGDIILDKFVDGRVERISPEAPIPILLQKSTRLSLGGAGNVAQNICALGGQAHIVCAVGNDHGAMLVKSLCKKIPGLGYDFFTAAIPTTVKTRFSAQGQQILRFDEEEELILDDTARAQLLALVQNSLNNSHGLIISDYGKGMCTADMVHDLIHYAKKLGVVTFVNPKGDDYSKYNGADYITPNRSELRLATKIKTDDSQGVVTAAQYLQKHHQIGSVLATRSEQGLTLIDDVMVGHFCATARQVYDVAGAGDTVIAAFALTRGLGMPPMLAARIANSAAGVVVEKSGTAVSSRDECAKLWAETTRQCPKLVDIKKLTAHRKKYPDQQMVFTNGCFDMLHRGHIDLLNFAKAQLGDKDGVLVVAVNMDDSVAGLKGDDRPYLSFMERIDLLAALPIVNFIVGFDAPTPLALIKALRPNILVKGMDYQGKTVVGAEYADRLALAPLLDGFSASLIIAQLTHEYS